MTGAARERTPDERRAALEAHREAGASPTHPSAVQRRLSQVLQARDCRAALRPPTAGGDAHDAASTHAIAERGVQGATAPLPHRRAIQASFGRHPVEHVRAAVGGQAATAAHAIGARAYAAGDRIAFSEAPDLHLAAHEAAHTVQQRAGVQLAGGVGQAGDPYERHADAVADAVVRGESAEPLLDRPPAGGAAGRAVQRQLDDCEDLEDADWRVDSGPADESPCIERSVEDLADEMLRAMLPRYGLTGRMSAPTAVAGFSRVTPDVAFRMLENVAQGQPPFRPELGVGRASWFVTEGTPYTGVTPEATVRLPVELDLPPAGERLTFDEAALTRIFEQKLAELPLAEQEARYREHKGLPPDQPLNHRHRQAAARFRTKLAERMMWEAVGDQVARSPQKVGEVILEGSRFSRQGNGRFAVVAEASRIRIRGGVPGIVAGLEGAGLSNPGLTLAAQEAARTRGWAGRVHGAFKWGGRILIVVGAVADGFHIYRARDRVRATVEVAGGWAGATQFGRIFASYARPLLAGGPKGIVLYGAGMLIAGGIGYWVGSGTTRTIYDLVIED